MDPDPIKQKYRDSCVVGDIEAVKYMLKYENIKLNHVGVHRNNYDYKYEDELLCICLNTACKSGHLDITNLIIDRLTKTLFNRDKPITHNLTYHMTNYMEVAKRKILCTALCHAFQGGNFDIISRILKLCNLNDSEKDVWDKYMLKACKGGHVNIFKTYLHKTSHNNAFWDKCLYKACRSGNLDLIKFIISKHKHTYEINHHNIYNGGLEGACKSGNLKIVAFMLKYGITTFSKSLELACRRNHTQVVKLLTENRSFNTKQLWKIWDLWNCA